MKFFSSHSNKPTKLKANEANSGFTLIETLVAISILAIAIVGPLSIANKGLFSSLFARDQITAYYLTQDAMEFIRNTRDSNLLNGNAWNNTIKEQCGNGQTCQVDTTTGLIQSCNNISRPENCGLLYRNPNSGFYTHTNTSGNDEQIFTRTIKYSDVQVGSEGRINITVSWNTGKLANNNFVVQENIFNRVQ